MLCTKLRLCDPGTHDASGREAAGDNVAHLIHDLRSTPLLVRKGLHAELPLLPLDKLHVSCSTFCCICLGEGINGEGVTVEACQSDELPAEAELRQIPDEGLHLCIRHAGSVPIERGAQIVSKHLVWNCSFDGGCKLLSLAEDWLASLHPDGICIWGKSNCTLAAEICGALDAVVTFYGAGGFPIKVHIASSKLCRRRLHLSQRHLQ
mmetsp:Transcript_73031/g.126667  ORF Transcript_73031/g.126667 Transcript_73031/m.126667 type:complete len:207 (-) Transcript_73031:277-897(-)